MRFVVNSACSLYFVVFEIFPVRCFGLRSLRIHDGVFVYIYYLISRGMKSMFSDDSARVGIYYLISRGMKSMFSDDSARVGYI